MKIINDVNENTRYALISVHNTFQALGFYSQLTHGDLLDDHTHKSTHQMRTNKLLIVYLQVYNLTISSGCHSHACTCLKIHFHAQFKRTIISVLYH